jgi:hypothetical protein
MTGTYHESCDTLPSEVSGCGGRPNAFTEVPAGCDSYLLVNVLHDWPDDDATRLLAAVVRATADGDAPGSRAVIVEGRTDARAHDEFTARTDLLMLALTAGGRERTGTQFAELGPAVGLRLERTVPRPSGSIAYGLRRAEAASRCPWAWPSAVGGRRRLIRSRRWPTAVPRA